MEEDIDNLDSVEPIDLQSKGLPLIEKTMVTLDNKRIDIPHEIKKQLFEDYMVPAHEPRKNSALYNQTHDDLVNTKDTPCWICGVSKSTLSDPTKNPNGSTQLETHHMHCEWSLANAVDWDVMKALHPDFTDWDKVDATDPSTYHVFVDSEYNMLVLCDIHHRGSRRGIHSIEHAIWQAQKFIKPTVAFIVDDHSKSMEDAFVDDLS